jgi:hypothetical protein
MSEFDIQRQQRVEEILSVLGDVDDAAASLANHVVRHMSGRVSDLGLPVFAFLRRWGVTLGSAELLAFADYVQSMVALAHPPKDAVAGLEAISLHDFLKGVELRGGS